MRIAAADGQIQTAAKGDKLFPGQKVITGRQSRAVLRFRDGSILTLGPDGEFAVKQFAFSPQKSGLKKDMKVLSGAFRYISGFAVKRKDVTLRTPVASMGVRGSVVEGVVSENVPNFVNVPQGSAQMSVDGASVNVKGGQSSIGVAGRRPTPPTAVPTEVRAQAIQFIQKELGEDLPPLPELTAEEMKEDAEANRQALALQLTEQPDATGGAPVQPLSPTDDFVPAPTPGQMSRLLDHLERVAQLAGQLFDRVVAQAWAFPLISEAQAAGQEEVLEAVNLLTEAAQLGLLSLPEGATLTGEQRQFLAQAAAAFPQAAAVIQTHVARQLNVSTQTVTTSARQVTAATARNAANQTEVAQVVANAIQAVQTVAATTPTQFTNVIVTTAVQETNAPDATKAAAQISAVAAKADPTIAATAAVSAVNALPAGQQAAAAARIGATTATSAPERAAEVAAAVARQQPTEAAKIGAAITQVATQKKPTTAEQAKAAADVAVAVAQTNPAQAASIGAAIAKIATQATAAKATQEGGDSAAAQAKAAADVAAAVAQGNPTQAAKVAAAVTKATGTANATAVAAAVSTQAGVAQAAKVAAAVAKVAPTQASQIAATVAQSAGEGVNAGAIAAATAQASGAPVADVAAAVAQASNTTAEAVQQQAAQAQTEVTEAVQEAGAAEADANAAEADVNAAATEAETTQAEAATDANEAEQAVDELPVQQNQDQNQDQNEDQQDTFPDPVTPTPDNASAS
ncbi:hypothetical protein MAIT1_02509 [Magnetofaba australis IT-1]|uniref:FecR protein domain-containing protein n=1 Tax=Magnetofaba australis IT-1 TaxID=1434232 RepID=A0A1Y2K304_9PROT|nr:hypothetical protein MAIT1_02509 [Magnetofaba australis IT-1]